MNFANSTGLQAGLVSGGISEEDKGAIVVARATLRLDGNRFVPNEQQWPVFKEPLDTAFGKFPTDFYPFRSGCDLVVVGHAVVSEPVTSLLAMVRVGDFSRQVLVSGDRVWVTSGDGHLVPSAPRPFSEMPMDWSRAFGGTATLMGEPVPFPLNPKGIGFHASAEEAVGKPLPNLEDPAQRIQRWDDRPLPVSWWPVQDSVSWQLTTWVMERAARGEAAPDPDMLDAKMLECFPTPSPPSMVMPGLSGGERVSISLGAQRMDFTVPRLNYRVTATVGAQRMERRFAFTGLWVIVPQRLVVLTLQTRFRYTYRPREERVAVLETCS